MSNDARAILEQAREWIGRQPHGDDCFVSAEHPGDPNDRCFCGKDPVGESIDAFLAGEHRECGNANCGWTGITNRMLGAIGPLCPDCGEVTEQVSTARGCNPKEDASGDGSLPAAGSLRTAIEEALASLEAGMVIGAVDTLERALAAPSAAPVQPVAWIRYCSDGCIEGPILHASMEEVRKQSGAWTPLYAAPPSAAPATPKPLTEEAAYEMGAAGAPPTESERLLFEAWMRGHCWALCATWDGKQYRSDAEQGGDVDPRAMATRRIWAAWRDRAALGIGAATKESGNGE